MYAKVKDIKNQFQKRSFKEGTFIDESELKKIILRKSRYINARICFRYVVPIDEFLNCESYAILNQICVWLVTSEVEEISQVARTIPKDSKLIKDRSADLMELAMDELLRVESGKTVLSDANENRPSRIVHSPCQPTTFKKGVTQW